MEERYEMELNPYLLIKEMNKGFVLLKANKNTKSDPNQFEILDVNPIFESMVEKKESALIGKKLSTVMPLEDECSKQIMEVVTIGQSRKFEYYISELERWLLLSVYRPQKGYLAIICDDITEEKILKLKFIESQKSRNAILDVAGEGLWEWRFEDGIVHHNKRWCTILGLDESFLSHPYEQFIERIYPDDREHVQNLIDESIKNQTIYFSEHRMIDKDGSIIWVEDRGLAVLGQDNQVNRMIGSITDITKYKQARQDLYLEKELFEATLLSVGDGIIATDVSGRIVIFNPSAEKFTGWDKNEVVGRNINEVFRMVHPITKNTLYSFDDRITHILDGDSQSGNDRHAIVVTHSGKELAIRQSVASINLPDGSIKGFVIVFTDVTSLVEEYKKVEHLSFHDDLTGLYNRRYMMDALHRLDTNRNLPLTVMMLDMNHLKLTNDTYGHAMGDRLIKKAAEFLKGIFRQEDIVSRTGGDEFCILLPKTSNEQAEAIKERILQEAHLYDTDQLPISLAVGYAIKTKEEENIEVILRTADSNMYKNKNEMRC